MLLTGSGRMTRMSAIVSAIVVIGFALSATDSAAQTSDAPRCGAGVHESEALGVVGFPQDQIFCPTVADPKEARSFVSLLRGTFRSLDDPSGKGTTHCVSRAGRQFRPGSLGRTVHRTKECSSMWLEASSPNSTSALLPTI